MSAVKTRDLSAGKWRSFIPNTSFGPVKSHFFPLPTMNNPIPPVARPSDFSDEQLDALRMEGDLYADALAAKIFGAQDMHSATATRLGYNKLVDIADLLEADSELLLVKDSNFAKALSLFPEEFQDYYDPMPAPDWVDVTKLEMAADLWKANSLAMLGVLYAASLPACYLMKRGIPALYQTAKLKDQKYVFQRIYETGLMLDAVMSPGGIELVQDVMPDADDVFLRSLNTSQGGEWEQQGDKFVKRASGFESSPAPVLTGAAAEGAKEKQNTSARCEFRVAAGRRSFLWGKGYIAAKKVRMLHASMRFMLLNPQLMVPTNAPSDSVAEGLAKAHSIGEPWKSEELGVPVNQEDLAFTLLTFSYLIPRGLEMIGCELKPEQKDAFLHLWRVVGHIMGLRDDLMTDQWAEAEKLYQRIHRLQAGSSPQGIALTEAVMGFLKTYLPDAFGISKRMPVALIAAQMGTDAKLLLSDANNKVLASPLTKFSMFITRISLIIFYRHYQRMLRFLPVMKRVFGDLLFNASEQLVLSWRDEYTRKPFYVPLTVDTWQLQKGVTDEFRAKLHSWRQRLFIALASSLAATFVMFIAFTVGIVAHFAGWREVMLWSMGITLAALCFAIHHIDIRIPSIFTKRPTPDGVSTRGK